MPRTSEPSLPELILISLSGATATGKSTLLAALENEIARASGAPCVRTPSPSLRLFERWRDRKLSNAPFPVATYDEIDKRGHREWFQRQLPESLAFEVEAAALTLRTAKAARSFMLVDRWFPDIMAFTRQSLRTDDIAQRQIRRLCQSRHEQVMAGLRETFAVVPVHVFIPLSSCRFAVTTAQDGKFRATTNRDEWEQLCLEEWPSVVDRLPALHLASSDLNTRVFDVKMALQTARKSHAKPAASSPRS